jgi:hypothetical protein
MSRVFPSLSILALCAASPALADVTAAELWAEWQEQAVAQSQTLTADEVIETAAGLTLRGVTRVFDEEEVTVTSRVEDLVMENMGDGTVAITPSELTTLVIEVPVEGDPPAVIELDLRQTGLNIVAGGTVDARSYAYTAEMIEITEGALSGGPGTPPEVTLLITARDLAANYLIDGSDPDNLIFDSDSTIASVSAGLDVVPSPPDQGRLKASFLFEGLSTEGSGQAGSLAALDQEMGTLPEGFDVSALFAFDAGRMNLDFDDEAGTAFEARYTNGGTAFTMDVTDEVVRFDYSETDTAFDLVASDMPLPISVSYSGAEMAMEVPIAGGEAPVPFGARLALSDLIIDEALWSMFDPSRAVARDPLTMIVDLSGTAVIMTDLMDLKPDEMNAPPGELRSLSINELQISAGGANLTGTGDMTFAPDQVIPMPVGQIDLAMTGGNALLDSLAATGLVPNEQLMMVRAMTGMFARPGPEPDSLESLIEFGADGSITANGMPLQ